MKPRIFVSYAHDDTKWLKLLDPHLAGLKHLAQVEDKFDDRKVLGGDHWGERIKAELEQADIFLALVTANFVGSEYIRETELPTARKREAEGKCVVFPVLFDHCYWKSLGIDEINFLPKDDNGKLKPISQWGNRKNAALAQVAEHLHKQIEAIVAARSAGAATTARTGIDLALYRARAQAKWSAIDLAALARPGAADPDIIIRLADVFVPPQARRSRPPMPLPRDWLRRQGLDPDKEAAQAEQIARTWEQLNPEPALGLIAQPGQRRLVLLGDPGAGKSALTRFVLLQLLAETPPAGSPLAVLHGHLPLLIELRDFVLREAEGRCTDLLSYLGFTGSALGFGFSADAVAQHLARAPALLIIDGLDEIFDPHRRRLMADQIVGLATRFPQLRVLVTARIAGFDDQPFRSADFATATLVDLSPEQVAAFAQHWFGLVFPGDPAAAERARDDLLQTVQRRPQLRALAGNPMLLTIMATVARHNRLAQSRADLYAQALELLCYNWDYRRGLELPADSPLRELTPRDTSLMLRRIAWRMQEAPDGLRGNAMAEADLLGVLEQFFRDDWHFDVPKAARAARDMAQRLQDRNWVVTLRGPGLYSFVHRTFLEYLCATEIAEQFKTQFIDAGTLIKTFVTPRLRDDTWHEVLLLIAGSLPIGVAETLILALLPDRRLVPQDAPQLGLAWQTLAEVEQRLIPSMAAACAVLNERLCDWLYMPITDSSFESFKACRETAAAIANAADAIGILSWPAPHPPCTGWPGIAEGCPRNFGPSHREAAMHVVATLGRTVWNCRVATIRWLSDFATDDPDQNVRRPAVTVLSWHFNDDPSTVELLFASAVDDPAPLVREAALTALAYRCGQDSRSPELLRNRAMLDPAYHVRQACLMALASQFRAEPQTLELLRDRLVNDPSKFNRMAVLEELARRFRDEPRTSDLLRVRAVDDPDGSVGEAALRALVRHFRDELCTRELLRARADDDPDVSTRRAALAALAEHFGDEARTGALIRSHAVDDPDADVRGDMLLALSYKLGIEHAQVLCSRDLDGNVPGLDARKAITQAMVAKAATKLGKPKAEIRGLYEQIACVAPLTLAWQTPKRKRAH